MAISAKLNLQQRFAVTSLFIIALTASAMVIAMNYAVHRHIMGYAHKHWSGYADILAHTTAFSVLLDSNERSQHLAKNFTTDAEVIKTGIYTHTNKILAVAGDASTECKLTPNENFTRPFNREENNYWCFFAPIYSSTLQSDHSGPFLGHVEIAVSKASINQLLQQILIASLTAVGFFSLLIYITVWQFTNVFTSTLSKVSHALMQRKNGSRGIQVDFKGSQDLNDLRQAFNAMLIAMDDYEYSLEHIVATRTQELQVALDKLRSSSQYQDELMAIIPHEMKTPLTGLKNYLQLAHESALKAEQSQETGTVPISYLVEQGLICTTDMETQINQWLTFAKLNTNNFAIERTRVDIGQLIQRCISAVDFICKQNGNTIHIDGSSESILIDGYILHHVIINILNNACKFTSKGIILVAWKVNKNNNYLTINISDTGIGIPAEYRDKIFEPFWQVDMRLARRYGGNGLGLAIVKQFMNLLAGEVEVLPNNPTGTAFKLTIPII